MKKQLLALGSIAMLLAACSKNNNDTPRVGPDPTVYELLTGYFSRTDSTKFEYDLTTLNPTAAYYYYSDDGDIGGYNEYYKYSSNKLSSVFSKEFDAKDSTKSHDLVYDGDKIIKVIAVGEDPYLDSVTYKDNKVEKIYHSYKDNNGKYYIANVDSFVWTGNNISKTVHTGGESWVDTYTFDNNFNPLTMVKGISLIESFDARWVSENNVLTQTRLQNNATKVNTFEYKLEGGKVTSIRADIHFDFLSVGGRSYKDTFNLSYKVFYN